MGSGNFSNKFHLDVGFVAGIITLKRKAHLAVRFLNLLGLSQAHGDFFPVEGILGDG